MPDISASLDHTTDFDAATDTSIRAGLALEAGRIGSWSWNVEKNALRGDELAAEYFGLDYASQPWSGEEASKALDQSDFPAVEQAMREAVEKNEGYQVEFRRKIPVGTNTPETEHWIRSRGRVSSWSETGQARKFVGVVWDITHEKLHEKAVTRIAGDMDHRAKNAFAIIRAMINLGKRTSTNVTEFADILRGQVEAMASGHSLAAKVSRATEVSLAPVSIVMLIENTLQPWTVTLSDDGDHIKISGSKDLSITADRVNSLAMILAQLAQQSEKNGALLENRGTITISVRQHPTGDLEVDWTEQTETARPIDSDDPGKQFGEILMTHSVSTLMGKLTREDNPNSKVVTITFPA